MDANDSDRSAPRRAAETVFVLDFEHRRRVPNPNEARGIAVRLRALDFAVRLANERVPVVKPENDVRSARVRHGDEVQRLSRDPSRSALEVARLRADSVKAMISEDT